jgi:hypothetical protein
MVQGMMDLAGGIMGLQALAKGIDRVVCIQDPQLMSC